VRGERVITRPVRQTCYLKEMVEFSCTNCNV